MPPERLVEEDVEDHVDGGVDHQKDVAGKEWFFLFFKKLTLCWENRVCVRENVFPRQRRHNCLFCIAL